MAEAKPQDTATNDRLANIARAAKQVEEVLEGEDLNSAAAGRAIYLLTYIRQLAEEGQRDA